MAPITFRPLYMKRVWGGRSLETIYNRSLPTPDHPYGEAWEIVDRPGEQSVVDHGLFAGKTLHELWSFHRTEIFGEGYETHDRFPLLIKTLDSRDDLSLQVHPPLSLAASLGGEPKTEMWFIAAAEPGAQLYIGLKNGVTRADFEAAIADGSVASLVHAVEPRPGESIFIPSGRLHAIGAGFLIHEIQQNSDTTYRVFDWNRMGLDGKPRDLHIAESLASIDFDDYEPGMDAPDGDTLAACPFFQTHKRTLAPGQTISSSDHFLILSVIEGNLVASSDRAFTKGNFLLLPRSSAPLTATEETTLLEITLPRD